MWNLFGRKGKAETQKQNENADNDWSFLKIDMHSHILPGIDDGAQTLEDSLMLVEQLQQMGFSALITTPHIKQDHFPNSRESIENALHILNGALEQKNIIIPVKASAEYYLDDHFLRLLEINELMPISGNELLIELSFMYEPVRFYDILFRIQTAGYRPVLAHPERYVFYHSRMEVYHELKNRGCLLQLNTISLSGYYGRAVKQVATRLLKEGLFDYCGSDMHHLKHAEALRQVRTSPIYEQLRNYPFLNAKLIL